MLEKDLRDLICSKYKSIRAFADAADLPYTTVDSILKRGIDKATVKNVIKLCQTLNIDTDALADGRIMPRKALLNIAITSNEKVFLSKIRSLDDQKKAVVLSVLDLAYTTNEQFNGINDFSERIPFRISSQPASAGTGIYLGPDGFDEIMVSSDHVAKADFGVPVRGDSMVPQFYDGDIIMISTSAEVEIGDIALVTLDGNGFVKKLGKRELISLNPKYAPIPLDESFHVCGKVIGTLNPEWILD